TNTHTMSVDCLFLTMQRPPSSTLFPYTTLFRSLWPHARFDGFHPRLFHFQRGLWSFPFHTSTRGLSLSARFGHGGRMEQRRRARSEEHTSELQSLAYLVCRLLLEKKKELRVSAH